MVRPTIQQLVDQLHLQPLPGEGGLYTETYRAAQTIAQNQLPDRYNNAPDKPLSTAILYLLTDAADSFSALHRLPTDEVYHFYLGDPLQMTLLTPDGAMQTLILGPDLQSGQKVQAVIPAGTWQGSRLMPNGSYALVGTTMAPGFTPSDYTAGQRADLLARYPQARERIIDLTRETTD